MKSIIGFILYVIFLGLGMLVFYISILILGDFVGLDPQASISNSTLQILLEGLSFNILSSCLLYNASEIADWGKS